jgi:hypothetical protein
MSDSTDDHDITTLGKPHQKCSSNDSFEFLKKKMKTDFPVLPICTEEEYKLWWKLFPKYVRTDGNGNQSSLNFSLMSSEWNEFADGKSIHKKLPCHLQNYFTKYFKKILSKRLSTSQSDRDESNAVRESLNNFAICLPSRDSSDQVDSARDQDPLHLSEQSEIPLISGDDPASHLQSAIVHADEFNATSDSAVPQEFAIDHEPLPSQQQPQVQLPDPQQQPQVQLPDPQQQPQVQNERSGAVISSRGEVIPVEAYLFTTLSVESSKKKRRKETQRRRPKLCRFPDPKAAKICGSKMCTNGCKFKDRPELWIDNPGSYKRQRSSV